MCIFVCHLIPPTDEPSIEAETFHSNMFFYADGQSVEGPYCSLMLCIVCVQFLGPSKSPLGEKFGDAIYLRNIIRYIQSK